MKLKYAVVAFALFGCYGVFCWVHYEYAKTAAGYNWWFYSGIAATVISVGIAALGFMGQKGKK